MKNKKMKNSRKIQEDFFSEPDKEPEERKQQEQTRARAHESEFLLEKEYLNLSDMIGGEPESESEPQEPVWNHCPEAEPDRKSTVITAESKTTSAEPKAEKVHLPDWNDELGSDKEGSVRFAGPKVIVNTEPSLEPESKASIIANAEPELKVDPKEIKFAKKVNDLDDW